MNAVPPILSELGSAALDYAARGWAVFPLKPNAKLPLISEKMGGKGHLDATTDQEQIRKWWTATPNANIGLHLAASGLVAVDPDTYKPDCEWHSFIQGRDLPDTLVQSTPRGGKHYIFRGDPGAEYAGGPCKGVETKHKGYIVLEPSVYEGRRYQFETDDDPAPCPAWVPIKAEKKSPEIDTGVDRNNVDRLSDLLRGIDAHDNTRDLVASLVASGVPPKAVSEIATAAVLSGLEPGARRNDRLKRIDYHVRSAMEKFAPDAPPERASQFYSAASLKGKPVKPREWLVHGLVPKKNVTLFSGDGGTGKSLLALQLAIGAAAECGWLGKPVNGGGVIFLSAEDDDDELHRRTDDILRAYGRNYDDLSSLTMRSLAGEDALLAVETKIALAKTALFDEIEARAGREQPALIVLDTLADLYPANENDRAAVRQFVSILRGLAIRQKCAVLLLAHPSLTGLNSGTGTSGSTAWNNSVRSRLYLERIVQDGYEPDPDKRVMSTKKANYGRTGDEINMSWQQGVFVAEEQPTGLDALAAGAKAERVFLKLLDEYTAQGRYVSASPSSAYAPTQFAAHPKAEGMTKRALRSAMEALFHRGEIEIAQHGKGSKARSHIARKGVQDAE